MKTYYIYILASRKNGTLYIGVTNNIAKRIHQHKSKASEGFTKRYNVHQLVWYDQSNDIHEVLQREKQMKKWKRQWKINLIEEQNPNWRDLSEDFI